MQHEIQGNPDYGQLTVSLEPGDAFLAEAGAVAWMSDGMQIKARLLAACLRRL